MFMVDINSGLLNVIKLMWYIDNEKMDKYVCLVKKNPKISNIQVEWPTKKQNVQEPIEIKDKKYMNLEYSRLRF